MNALFAISLTTGILSGVLAWLAPYLGLISWAAFLGCTTYFANSTKGIKGVITGLLANLSGVGWAMLVIYISTLFSTDTIIYLMTAVVSFAMCIQSAQKLLFFIPGAFVGACATFASHGDWQHIALSLCLGGIFAYTMKHSGDWLASKF